MDREQAVALYNIVSDQASQKPTWKRKGNKKNTKKAGNANLKKKNIQVL